MLNTLKTRLESSRKAGGALLILLLGIVSYWPSLRGGFVWDDLILVEKNPLVTGATDLKSVWFSADFCLTTVTTWIEWLVFGKNPLGYRIVNLVLHITSALLLWRVLTHLKISGAWLAALLFTVHPICVTSVAWISELKNTLSLPLFLSSIWAFLEFAAAAQRGDQRMKRLMYGLSILAFVLGLMAKTSIVMLPVVLLLIAWWQRGAITKVDCYRVIPHFAFALIFGLMSVWFQTHQAIRTVTVQHEDFLGRSFGAAGAIWFYLGKTLLPLDLCMIYPRWETSTVTWKTTLPLMLLGLSATLLWCFRKRGTRPLLFATAVFAVTLFPALGFFDMYFLVFSRVSDHFAYLPIIAILALVAAGISSIKIPMLKQILAGSVAITLTFLAWQRAGVFVSDAALWQDTVTKNPNAWNAHNNLACNLAERGDLDGAMKHFARSLELNPRNVSARRNFGRGLAMQGQFTEAESHFRMALAEKPDDWDTLTTYADVLASQNRLDDAVTQLRAAIQIKPDTATRLRLAAFLSALGQFREAINELQLAVQARPDAIEALNNLAWLLATSADASLRNGPEAVRLAEKAVALSPKKSARCFGTLGAAYAEAGQFPDAIKAAQQAIELARAAGDYRFAQANDQLQQLYRQQRAYHEPVRAR